MEGNPNRLKRFGKFWR